MSLGLDEVEYVYIKELHGRESGISFTKLRARMRLEVLWDWLQLLVLSRIIKRRQI